MVYNKPYKVAAHRRSMADEENSGVMSEKEQRIKAITRLYYSNPKVQEALLSFSKNREVVPRYFEGFGKRPDTLQYVSDVMGLVNKGATSFHASEELWRDPLVINADMGTDELTALRISWDLLIDVDSPFLDWSRIVAELLLEALEAHGVRNYGIKFSGSKGWHIIVSGAAFPSVFEGVAMPAGFPEWPRAICRYLMHVIREEYNRRITAFMPSVEVIQQRTQKTREELLRALCPSCGQPSEKGMLTHYSCDDCGAAITRLNIGRNGKELKCINCPGMLHIVKSEEYFFCLSCKMHSFDTFRQQNESKVTYTKEARERKRQVSSDFSEQVSGEVIGGSDLVLVAPRHLFRMPYSLHEKTALASVVLSKQELATFTPRDANPLKVAIHPYLLIPAPNEAAHLLSASLAWKQEHDAVEATRTQKTYAGKKFDDAELQGVTDAMFPPAIKKLLRGLADGKKRGLFVLVTFLRCCGFLPEDIAVRVAGWNAKNQPPLKEGYIKSQLDWHFRQKKKVLPPNYDNEAFYKDIGLLEKKPETKNPLVDVKRARRDASPQSAP